MQHHPKEDIILACAAGTIDPNLEMVVRAHIALCPACQEQLAFALAIGGGLLEQRVGESIACADTESALARTLTMLDDDSQASNDRRMTFSNIGEIDVLRQLFVEPPTTVEWQSLFPGVDQFLVQKRLDPGSWLRLLRLQPGMRLPRHTHTGDEYSVVLQGSYADETGCYAAGDFSEVHASLAHELTIDSDVPCIALIGSTGRIVFERRAYNRTVRCLGW